MLPIALALMQFAPTLASMLGGPKAGDVANKVVQIAQTVTGAATPDAALAAIQADPAKALEFQAKVVESHVELARIDADLQKAEITAQAQNASDVNKTMQTEAASEHWPTYSWRPFIGFVFGLNMLIATITASAVFIGVMCGMASAAQALAALPQMLGALAAINGLATPVLGIASYFRGKMQADPSVPTNNKG
jgi:hypothetical protein